MATLPVQIVTPVENIYSGEVAGVILPAHDGERGVLPNHADFIGKLGTGVVCVKTASKEFRFAVSDGAYQVSSGELTIMAMEAMKPEGVKVDHVREELASCEEALAGINRIAEDVAPLERKRDYCQAQLDLEAPVHG